MKKSFKKCMVSLLVLATLFTSSVFSTTSVMAVDSGYFGVNDHPEWYSDYVSNVNQLIATGVKWVRIAPNWGAIEPSKGYHDPNYAAKLDYIVNTLTNNGLKIDFVLCYTANWASQYPTDTYAPFYKPANYTDWQNYVSYITNRYKGKVTTWEVWNEEDASGFWKSTVNDYFTLLQYAYNQVKATDPNNTVLIGGLTFMNGTSWFESLVNLGGTSYFDKINYHTYADSVGMLSTYNNLMAVVNNHSSQLGSKKIWITETGYTTGGDSTKEAYKADYMDETSQLHKRFSNIEKIFDYCFRNTATGNVTEDNLGLVQNDLTPLKALPYLQSTMGCWSEFTIQNAFPTQAEQTVPLKFYKGGDGNSIYFSSGDMVVPDGTYMYMRLNDNWLYNTNNGVNQAAYVDITYFDSGTNAWGIHYDGKSNAYTLPATEYKTNTGTYKTKTYLLSDILFANRENFSSDLRVWTQGGDLRVQSIIVRKQANRGAVVLGSTDTFTMLKHAVSTVTTDEAYNPPTTIGGLACRQITDNSHYMYFTAGKGLAKAGDTNLKIGVTYYNSGTDKILIQYNAVGNNYKPLYITKTNTNTWLYAELTVTDANFTNTMSYGADFRIGNNGDGSAEYIYEALVNRQ